MAVKARCRKYIYNSIVGIHIKVLRWLSCLIRCVLNRCNRHDRRDIL